MENQQPVLTEIIFQPEHFNHNCDSAIPEAYIGIVVLNYPLLPIDYTRIFGASRDEVIKIAKSEGIKIAL